MAPNHQVSLGHDLPESSATAVPAQEDDNLEDDKLLNTVTEDPSSIPSCSADTADQQEPYLPLKWHNIIAIGIFHVVALYGFCIATTDAMWRTLLFCKFTFIINVNSYNGETYIYLVITKLLIKLMPRIVYLPIFKVVSIISFACMLILIMKQ
jgi:hypothetical protein